MTSSKQPSRPRDGLVVLFLFVSLLAPLTVALVGGLPALSWVVQSQRSILLNNLIWAVGALVGVGVGSTLVAYLAFERPKLQRLLTVAVMPVALGSASVAVLWRLSFAFRPTYRAQVGIINQVFTTAGLPSVSWLTQEPILNTVVLGASLVWVATTLASLWLVEITRALPESWLSSARRYGATRVQRFRYIVWPFLKQPLIVAVTLAVVAAWHAHAIVQVATSGAFGTSVLGVSGWNRIFSYHQNSRGLAVTLVILGVSLALVALATYFYRRSAPTSPQWSRLRSGGRRSAPPREVDLPEYKPFWRLAAVVENAMFVVLFLAVIVPLVGIAITAFTGAQAAETSGWWNFRGGFTLDSLQNALADTPTTRGLWSAFTSSLIITLPTLAFLMVLGRKAAAGVLAMVPRRQQIVIAALVVAVLMPTAAVLLPVETVLNGLGLAGTYPGVWLAHLVVFTPLAILVCLFFTNLVESQRWVSIAAGSILFLPIWNDYTVAITALGNRGETYWPLPLELARHVATYGEAQAPLAAGTLIVSFIPVLVAILLLRPLLSMLAQALVSRQLNELRLENRYDQPYDDQAEQHRL